MRVQRGHWPAIGLGLQLMAGEFQPRALRLSDSGTTAARYAVLLVAAIAPLALATLRSSVLPMVLRRPPLTWVTAYLCWITIAVVWSIDPTHALQPALWVVSVTLYAVWFVSNYGWQDFEVVMARAGAAFIIAGGIYEVTVGLGGGRFQGFMLAATAMGRMGGIVAIFGVSLISRGRPHRRLGWIATAAGVLAVGASSTRTVAFALIFIAGWAWFRRVGRSAALLVTALAVTLGFTFVFAADNGLVIVSRTPDGTDFVEQRNGILVLQHTPGGNEYTTGTGRTDVWSAAWSGIEQRPIFGWGTGSSDRLFQEFAAEGRLNWIAVTAHDTALQALLEHGAIGFALLLAAAVSYRRSSRLSPNTTRTALIILLVINGVGESLIDIGRAPLVVLAASFAAVANDAAVGVTQRGARRRALPAPVPAEAIAAS